MTVTVRDQFTADMAGIEGDLGRARIDLSETGDIPVVINTLKDIEERVHELRESLVLLGATAMRKALDAEARSSGL